MNINELRTPAFLIDLNRLKQNAGLMLQKAENHHVHLRPHVKTHKTVRGARIQVDESLKVTVSTIAEANFYSQSGFQNITYAFPITADKFEDAARLTRQTKEFNIVTDQESTIDALQNFAKQHDIVFRVFLMIDTGNHREGVDPEKDESLHLAKKIADHTNTFFAGILTHAGQSYHCKTVGEIKEVAETERRLMVDFAQKLRSMGIECPEVSIGSTPTCMHADNWEGITEIRPGNYIFFDKFQSDIGSCSLDMCSATILTRIIGHYPKDNRMLIDAGALALSKDQGATHIQSDIQYGYIIDHPELKIIALSQEHGFVESDKTIPFHHFPVGSTLRIIPNHSCLAAALFPVYHIIDQNQIIDRWIPVRGW